VGVFSEHSVYAIARPSVCHTGGWYKSGWS